MVRQHAAQTACANHRASCICCYSCHSRRGSYPYQGAKAAAISTFDECFEAAHGLALPIVANVSGSQLGSGCFVQVVDRTLTAWRLHGDRTATAQ